MKTVTAFKINPRAPDKVVIELDGARLASLPADTVAQFDLSVGRLLTEDEYQKLSYITDVEAAHSRSLRMLTARPRAVNDLLRRLRAKGHNPSAAAEAVGIGVIGSCSGIGISAMVVFWPMGSSGCYLVSDISAKRRGVWSFY